MNTENIAVGLDIGTTKVVCVIAQRGTGDRIKVLGVGHAPSTGVQRGVVHNVVQTMESVKQAVSMAESQCDHQVNDLIVGIAGQHIRSIQHSESITRENPEDFIDHKDINALIGKVHGIVLLPGEEIIHILPQVYKVDSESGILDPIGMSGSRLEANFHIVVGRINSIQNIGRCVKGAGYKISGLTLEPLASATACLNDDEKDAGVALLDIGGGTTDIAIFKDGIIRHTSVIPFGGKAITEDIKNGFQIIEKQAELLKIKFGSCTPLANKENEIVSIPGLRGRDPKEVSLRNLATAIHARVEEILNAVDAIIKGYEGNDPTKKLIAGIVITGGGAKLKHLKTMAKFETLMDTRIGYPQERIEGEMLSKLSSPIYATSIGLAIQAVESKERAIEEALIRQEELEKQQELEQQISDEPFYQSYEASPEMSPSEVHEEPRETAVQDDKDMKKILETSKKKVNFLERWSSKFLNFLEGDE
ncbi:MAG: cell division protein FtsA [Flavobacteriales bacterium]|jgi:cell division protein FtsA|nr:cell division protein FtsA [Flavobacteriales bacterium]